MTEELSDQDFPSQSQLDSSTSLPAPPSVSTEVSPRWELSRALEPLLGISTAVGKTHKGTPKDSGYRRRRYIAFFFRTWKSRTKEMLSHFSGSPLTMLSKYQMMVDLSGAFGGLLSKIDQPLKEAAQEVCENLFNDCCLFG